MPKKDYPYLIGTRKSRLTILKVLKKDNRNYLECLCDCGDIVIRRYSVIISNKTKNAACISCSKIFFKKPKSIRYTEFKVEFITWGNMIAQTKITKHIKIMVDVELKFAKDGLLHLKTFYKIWAKEFLIIFHLIGLIIMETINRVIADGLQGKSRIIIEEVLKKRALKLKIKIKS